MSGRTKILTFAFSFLIAINSCNSKHSESKHRPSHLQKSENNHSSKLKEQRTMKIEKPNRVSHSYEQTIRGTIEDIMPLYCPVRELDWCENWYPKVVYSNSGVVEKDCIFITPNGETDIVWIVTDYDIEKGRVEMFYHVPEVLVTKLEIQLTTIAEKSTKAILTYSKISLSQMGDKVLEEFTREEYYIMMDSWEKAMNHYLETGKMLTGLPNF